MIKGGYVYIMSNRSRSTYYVGVTSNLSVRSSQHKKGEGSKFTKRYNCFDLVYYEFHDTIIQAIEQEKQLKRCRREWKDKLIKSINTDMSDLYEEARDLV